MINDFIAKLTEAGSEIYEKSVEKELSKITNSCFNCTYNTIFAQDKIRQELINEEWFNEYLKDEMNE